MIHCVQVMKVIQASVVAGGVSAATQSDARERAEHAGDTNRKSYVDQTVSSRLTSPWIWTQ